MLIPLGFLAASGVSGATFQLLETAIVSGSSTSVVTFSNLSAYASTYQHLQIRLVATVPSGDNWLTMSFNNVTTNSLYRNHLLRGTGSAVNAFTSGGEGNGIGYVMNIADTPSPGVIDILDPWELNKNKVIRGLVGNARAAQFGAGVAITSGLYVSTDTVSSIEIRVPASNYVAGSRFSLYGIKATA